MEKVTVRRLKEFGNVSKAIKWAKDQVGEYPQRPTRPFLPKNHTSSDAAKYANDYAIWEKEMEVYINKKSEIQQSDGEINLAISSYIKEESGLYQIPEQYQKKVYEKAYQDGHSAGYYEVYLKLIELVDIFT